jgi:hypothetical protein
MTGLSQEPAVLMRDGDYYASELTPRTGIPHFGPSSSNTASDRSGYYRRMQLLRFAGNSRLSKRKIMRMNSSRNNRSELPIPSDDMSLSADSLHLWEDSAILP